MASSRVYKLRSPIATDGGALTEVTVRRVGPLDRAKIAEAIRKEKRRTGRELSELRRGLVMVTTLCDLPPDLARHLGGNDVAGIAKLIGEMTTGTAR